MIDRKYTWGFCPDCYKNVPHVRVLRWRLFRILDQLSGEFVRLFRFGPWHCVHCEAMRFRLPKENPNASSFDISNLHSLPSSGSASTENLTSESTAETAEAVGNFIRSDQSLVNRATRIKRFSEKYRDAIVRRLMAGKLTFSQVREEQEITEAELIDWISDLFERMQAGLDRQANSPSNRMRLDFQDSSSIDSAAEFGLTDDSAGFANGPTIDGQVRPK